MAEFILGTPSTAVSGPEELLHDANVAIDSSTYPSQLSGGSPAHTPQRAAQTCTDKATGTKHEWWNGAWHS